MNSREEEILLFVYETGETRYTDLKKYFVPSRISEKTLINYKKYLEREGKLKKKISDRTNRPVYFIPQKHIDHVKALKAKRNFEIELQSLSPRQLVEIIEKLSRELKEHKRKERINELEHKPIPYSLLQKLFPKVERGKLTNWYYDGRDWNPDLFEVKTIPLTDYQRELGIWLTSDWKIVYKDQKKKIAVLCAWKELLRLREEQFEADWLKWKEDFKLSNEDWKKVGPIVRRMLEEGCIPYEIASRLAYYKDMKTPEGRERIRKWEQSLKKAT